MVIHIERAITSEAIKKFIDFPHELNMGDDNYVPEIFITQKKLFDINKNPFFAHSSAEYFLALNGEKVCGRIAVIRNGSYIEFSGNNTAFFGFFDVIDDYRVAKLLLNTAFEWARSNKFSSMQGPVNFSTNDSCGLLIEGFDSPPVIMMTYHKKYYTDFLERYGFFKKMDLLAYYLIPERSSNKLIRIQNVLEERLKKRGIIIRNISLRNFKSELTKVRSIYNSAWESNWGFAPMTKEEFDFAADDLKSILDTDFAFIAEHNGKPIGFSLTIPNLNEVTIRIKRGRLFPTGLFKLLYYKNKIKSVRVLTLGVIKEYRNIGIDACFYIRNIEVAKRKHIKWAEASWILEENEKMNIALKNIGGEVYKKYRIYGKEIA